MLSGASPPHAAYRRQRCGGRRCARARHLAAYLAQHEVGQSEGHGQLGGGTPGGVGSVAARHARLGRVERRPARRAALRPVGAQCGPRAGRKQLRDSGRPGSTPVGRDRALPARAHACLPVAPGPGRPSQRSGSPSEHRGLGGQEFALAPWAYAGSVLGTACFATGADGAIRSGFGCSPDFRHSVQHQAVGRLPDRA